MFNLFDRSSPMNKNVEFKNQNYASLKSEALRTNVLFLDPEFPPNEKSIGKNFENKKIEWKRPKDICNDPRFVVDDKKISHDIRQGELGNCWMVTACCCLASNKTFWEKVVPDYKEQDWKSTELNQEYGGIFHFCFYSGGRFVDVVIDDLLPTVNGKLLFVHNGSKNEFWCPLLEKAYAKFSGNYAILNGGELSEALEDFMGGVTEEVDLSQNKYLDSPEEKDKLYAYLESALKSSLMAVGIPSDTCNEPKITNSGLVIGHAYAVTLFKRLRLATGKKLKLVRLRHPWGNAEWKGAYGLKTQEWLNLTEKEKNVNGISLETEGDFWMKFDDLLFSFPALSICQVLNDSFFSLDRRWFQFQFYGEWRQPDRVGGCINNLDTFLRNPQYCFTINDEEDMILMLTQISETRLTKQVIGFTLLKVEDNRKYRLHQIPEVIESSKFKDSRSIVMKRIKQLKGRYVVIATMFNKESEGKFLMRIFLTSSTKPFELDEDLPSRAMCPCLPGNAYPQVVTRITLVRCQNLRRVKGGTLTPYFVMSYQGDKITSKVYKSYEYVDINFIGIFFRRTMIKPIIIDVHHSGLIRPEFLGRVTINSSESTLDKEVMLELTDKNTPPSYTKTGALVIHIVTSYNLRFF